MDIAADIARTEPSDRFLRTRERILDAAGRLINERGLKGLTFVGVAEAVDLNTTSITYYFKRKELLAEAALARSIAQLDDLLAEAEAAPDPQARVSAYLDLIFERAARVRRGEAQPMTTLSDIRAMEVEQRAALIEAYQQPLRRAAGFFGPARDARTAARNRARARVMMDCLHWMRAWLFRYGIEDFPRLRDRMEELFLHGFAIDGAEWTPVLTPMKEPGGGEVGREAFLRAATILINERGYRGASVERIAARLNVSKGSFYHHLDRKDDLVAACFERSHARVSDAQRRAIESDGTWWDRVTACIAMLLQVQFGQENRFPLLRTSAFQALPPEMRVEILRGSDRTAQRFAGMLIDGISEGSIRAVDPMIASQCLMAMLNGASDIHPWAAEQETPEAALRLYGGVLAFGMFEEGG